jgi:hypothetical protein
VQDIGIWNIADDVIPRSLKGRTFRKRLWKGREYNTGIRDLGLRQQTTRKKWSEGPRRQTAAISEKTDLKNIQVESTGNFDMNITKTTRLEIAK